MKVQEIDINLIKPYKNNPREIPIEAVENVKKSIKEFGNNQPIVIDQNNVIVVGHTRWRALKELGRKKAFVLKKDFEKSKAIAYRIMDNRSGENSKWEKNLLKQEIELLIDENFNLDFTGFTFDEIDKYTDNTEIFKAPNDIIADINTDAIQLSTSNVNMVQLFFNRKTAESFGKMIEELKKEYNTDNTTATVSAVIEREFKQYKKELTSGK